MHIPDGLLTAPVSLAGAGLAGVAVTVATAQTRRALRARAIALLGTTSAFVFAAQMLNFPVAGGTSGHLIGGVLTAVLVGPALAVIAMTAVLILQCLMFADGGLLALGANVLNLGIIHPLAGYAIFRAVRGQGPGRSSKARLIAANAFGSFSATLLIAATCAGELALSRVAPASMVLWSMLGAHVLIGVGEALITSLVLAALIQLRPELLDSTKFSTPLPSSAIALFGLTLSAALALFVSPFACKWPDGLEHVLTRLGIEPAHAQVSLPAPLREYALPGRDGLLATALAAVLGTLLVFGLSFGLGFALAPPTHDAEET